MTAWNEPRFPAPRPGFEAVRRQLLELLDDCAGVECERLRRRLHTVDQAQELWLLRGAIFQVVAAEHCQALAAERVERLWPAVQQLMPQRAGARA